MFVRFASVSVCVCIHTRVYAYMRMLWDCQICHFQESNNIYTKYIYLLRVSDCKFFHFAYCRFKTFSYLCKTLAH